MLRFHRSLPAPLGQPLLTRTDPTVEATARYVLDAALDRCSPTLPEALHPLIAEAVPSVNPEAALLGLTVVDPAVGSGHFVVAAARRIAAALAAVRTGDTEPGPQALRAATADVIERCIYGVDLNDLAAEITKVALWLEAFDGSRPFAFLDAHLKVGNSLLGTTPALLR